MAKTRDDGDAEPSNPRVIVQQSWSELGPDVVVHATDVGTAGQHHVVEVSTPTARELADLVGTILDLEFVLGAVGRLSAIGKPPQDVVVAQALWNSALVAYARCFGGGRRRGLNTSIFDSLNPGAAEAHQHMIDMRDKHVAHSVNPFDQVRVGAVLSSETSVERELHGTAHLRHQLVGWDLEGLGTLEYLAQGAHADAMQRFQELEARLFDELRSRPIDELYQMPGMSLVTPSPDDARKARR